MPQLRAVVDDLDAPGNGAAAALQASSVPSVEPSTMTSTSYPPRQRQRLAGRRDPRQVGRQAPGLVVGRDHDGKGDALRGWTSRRQRGNHAQQTHRRPAVNRIVFARDRVKPRPLRKPKSPFPVFRTLSRPPCPRPAAPPAPAAFPWARVGVVLLAAVLRLWDLDLRPPHFDEGVNGWFTDQMQHLGCYQYDPSNYHGPLHFYVLFLFKVLFGRHLWALAPAGRARGHPDRGLDVPLRAVPGPEDVRVGGVGHDALARLPLLPARRHPRDLARVLPGPGFLGGLRAVAGRRANATSGPWAWRLTGAILTKETYLIHLGCLVLAVPCLLVIESLAPSARTIFARPGNGTRPSPEDDTSGPPPLFDEVPPWSGAGVASPSPRRRGASRTPGRSRS